MWRFILFVLLAACALLTGCASDQPADPNRVSNIPWNRPESWESQGPLGGFMPGSH